MKYEILDKTGKNKRCTVTSLEYNGEFMGESYVLCKVESEVPIDFQTGDYLEYRGEKYEINYAPSVLKKCRASYNRDAFTYDSIKLNSASNDLVKCLFLDYVKEDNLIHLKSATKLFSVLLASKRPLITELADKLRLKYPLLPTISPCPTMRLEAIRSIIPISCRRYPKSV